MNIPIEKLTEAALLLPSDARALLADRLVESLDPITDDDIRDLWVVEALRRRDEVRAGTIPTIPGESALAQVWDSLKR